MDPLRALIEYLRENLQGKLPDVTLRSIEGTVEGLFAKFELVPKHEYQAHVDILKSLEAQVTSLESRLKALEEAT